MDSTLLSSSIENRLLHLLWEVGRFRLLSHLHPIKLTPGQILYDGVANQGEICFVESGIVSIMSILNTGRMIEVGSVGNEGVLGLPAFLGSRSHHFQYVVQVEGRGLRVSSQLLREHAEHDPPLRQALDRSAATLMTQFMQGVACNGLHSVQERCCRWLLQAQDRLASEFIPVTHDGLAQLLGVRRASISAVLQPLRDANLLRYCRGKLVITNREQLEAKTCECYRVIRDETRTMFEDLGAVRGQVPANGTLAGATPM